MHTPALSHRHPYTPPSDSRAAEALSPFAPHMKLYVPHATQPWLLHTLTLHTLRPVRDPSTAAEFAKCRHASPRVVWAITTAFPCSLDESAAASVASPGIPQGITDCTACIPTAADTET